MKGESGGVIGTVIRVIGKKLTVYGGSMRIDVPIFHNPAFPLAVRKGSKVLLILVDGQYICVGVLEE